MTRSQQCNNLKQSAKNIKSKCLQYICKTEDYVYRMKK